VAQIVISGQELVVRLGLLEKAGGVHADVRIPLTAVRGVRVAEDPWPALRGLRAPGTGWPGLIALGTRRGGGTREFAAVSTHAPAVVVDAAGAEFDRLVISSSTAAADAQLIAAAAPGTRLG
jgi:hypothetical protein